LPFFGLARGYLSGKYRGGNPGESARADGALEFASARGERLLSTLEEIARAHAVSIAAVALAWLAAQPTIAMPLASARTPAQLAELLPAATLRLAPAELASITAATDE
jgi:aryl-alcohol dehydrogenase-like predicted oxidoreductase